MHFCRLRVLTGLGDGLEVLVECPVGDVVAELFSLLDRVAVMEADPDAGVDDLVLDVGDGVVVACGRERGAAVGGAGDGDVEVLGAERGCERVGEGAGEAAMRGGYSGWLGVFTNGVQAGSAAVLGLPSLSAFRIAVIGRQNR